MDQPGNPTPPSPGLPAREHFDELNYRYHHPDIDAGVASGAIGSAWQHFSDAGFTEGRAWISQADPLFGVSREIAPGDEMFTGNADHYFEVGSSALRCIEGALRVAGRHPDTVKTIVDLPCGHGRVQRFLRKAFPQATLVACDLNRAGVDYCGATFGALKVYSDPEVDRIPLGGVFDLIWCGSLLTHLPRKKCAEFLGFFQRLLGRNGILVFTLHGRHVARELARGRNPHELDEPGVAQLLRQYREQGFGYTDYPGSPGYGFSLAHPSFVTASLLDDPLWRLLAYHEAGWDGRQDSIAVQKSSIA
jgi:hypothetical protein